MKPNLYILVLLLIPAALACKKHYYLLPEDHNPPAQKKWIVTTVAGNGEAHFADGPVAAAEFNAPQDIVVNDDGVIYVADALNHRIRKIATGQVSSFAGSNIYLADNNNNRIRKISFQ